MPTTIFIKALFTFLNSAHHIISSKKQKERMNLSFCFLVEVTGFEPAASWSRTKRTTKLCHTSLFNFIFVRIGDGFGLAAARSPHGSNTPPACYSLPFGRSLRSLPAASRSRTKRTTKLCHTSLLNCNLFESIDGFESAATATVA